MHNNILDTIQDENSRRFAGMFPEFSAPILEKLHFLIIEFGFDEPKFETAPRECWTSYKRDDAEIEIAYEPLSLPWGYVKLFSGGGGERLPLKELMNQYEFHVDEQKYRRYDEVSKKLFALLDSPEKADEYARKSKRQLEEAVALRVEDLATFLKAHLRDILSNSQHKMTRQDHR